MPSRSAIVFLLVMVLLLLAVYNSSLQGSWGALHATRQHTPNRIAPTDHGASSAPAELQHRFNKSSQSSTGATSSSSSSSSSVHRKKQTLLLTGEKCQEQTNLYYLKVHKAGSTCIQNLFWRFGVTRSLSIMLFKNKSPYPKRDFLSQLLPDPRIKMFDGRYDIFCEHSYFDEVQLNQSMKKNTAYIGILREPLSRLRSVLSFFGYAKEHNLDKKSVDLAEHLLSSQSTVPRCAAELFGYKNDSDPDTFLKEIDSKFKAIIVLERLDESLVLMKRKLCWHLKDIIYFPMRVNSYLVTKDEGKERLLTERLRKINEIDYLLYEHFVNRHSTKVANERNNFLGEVKLFMKVSDETKEFCGNVCELLGSSVAHNASHDVLMEHLRSEVTFPASQWESAFSVSGLDCIMMMLHSDVWRNAQKVTQYPDTCAGGNLDIKLSKPGYCSEHFAHSFPWEMLYHPQKYETFFFRCY